MYLSNKDLKQAYLTYLNIATIYNLESYIIENDLESCAFFYGVLNKHSKKIFSVIKSPKYSFYYIKYVKDNEISRAIINRSNDLNYKIQLCIIDECISVKLENDLLRSKNYNLIYSVFKNCKVSDDKKFLSSLLGSNKSKYIYASAIKSKRQLQLHLDKLIPKHSKTYIFAMLKKYPNLDYSKYEDYLMNNNLIPEIKKFLSIKPSDKLKNYLILL